MMTRETPEQQIARLRDNLKHIASQLVERTAQLAETRFMIDLLRHDTQAAINRMGDRKPGKLIWLGVAYGVAVTVLVGWVW